jgi:curved DNA-binding protein
MEYKNYYKILGVEKTTTQEEIKKAYRKLAVKYHPDKNQGNKKAEETFKEINEAYDVLGDVEKRKKYEQIGDNWQQHANQNQQEYYAQSNKKYNQNQSNSNESRFSDFFESIFGYSDNIKRSTTKRRGEDHQANTTITLEEAFHGTSRQVKLSTSQLNLKLKPGITDGQVLKMKEKGGTGINGAPAGDLYITIQVAPHNKYERKGNDLYADEPLDVFTAIKGGKQVVSAIDKQLTVTIPAGTDSNKVFRLKGMGMPHYDNPQERGDYYARLVITVPKNLTTKENNLIDEWEKLRKK